MRSPFLVILSATLFLTACESRLNPVNWFGRSTEERVATAPTVSLETDPRPLVDEVTAMAVERIPGGAIVRAVGRPARQGYWAAELVPVTGDEVKKGTRVFDFRIAPPDGSTRTGTPQSRELSVATFLSDQALAGHRTIIVRGARNQRRARR
ncbi:hypothetical protein RGUI_3486 [Rhodovulum sp. P5]|uniref:hypothetical protein n=1 Tax=Rhodovulum sp. P5 TaxID=1564506 RepID=UPI0009C39AC5|nr:hypothetical protein [Rhodovulum sp. P5]ARE41627.1 hypothetical protein RGUI_3486 [Rhodovulum sp. P5]